jgi:TPR repeat protein
VPQKDQLPEPVEEQVPISQLATYSPASSGIKDVIDLRASRRYQNFFIGIGVCIALLLAASPWWWPSARANMVNAQIEQAAMKLKDEQLRLWNEARAGNQESRLQLASQLSAKEEPNANHELARKLLEQAADQGDPAAALLLGHRFKDGTFGEIDANAARKWYQRAFELANDGAKIGDATSMWILGHLYANGLYVSLEISKGQELQMAAANKEPKKYAEEIARNFKNGVAGFPRDITAAMTWYNKFANTGSPSDAYNVAIHFQGIAHILESEKDDPQSIASFRREAIRLLQTAAEGGNKFAMFDLAEGILEKQKMFVGSEDGGEKWLAKAVSAGSGDALWYKGIRLLMRDPSNDFPSEVDDLFVRAWKNKRIENRGSGDESDRDKRFVDQIATQIQAISGFVSVAEGDGGKPKLSVKQSIRMEAWSQASDTLNGEPMKSFYEQNKSNFPKVKLLREQILQFAQHPDLPDRWPRMEVHTAPVDEVVQRLTGYLGEEQQIFEVGRSTFTVDNSDGAASAEVRLYRGNKRIRSFFVQVGSTFTADKLPPGIYRFRYKINMNGKMTVFEAKEDFVLAETPVENGIRSSKMSVTLFKVPNGNLRMAEVSPDNF